MLAECHGRLGSDEQRLEVLQRAAEGEQGRTTARLELVRALAQSGQLDQAIETLSPMAIAGSNPEWRLDLVRLLLQKTVRQPRDRRNWPEVERHLGEAEKAMAASRPSRSSCSASTSWPRRTAWTRPGRCWPDRWPRSPATWAIGWRWPG